MSGSMKPYVVQQGDYLEKLAQRFGFDAQTVWNDGANGELRKLRMPNQLCPGDILHIPDSKPVWLPLDLGSTNQYRARIRRVPVNLVFELDGKSHANEPCVVEGLGPPIDKTTDGDGRLSLLVPVTVREFSVRFVKRNVVHRVAVGDMDPVDERTGAIKRLVHLGYLSHSQARDVDAVSSAISRFQNAEKLPPSGVLDDETKVALVRTHGS